MVGTMCGWLYLIWQNKFIENRDKSKITKHLIFSICFRQMETIYIFFTNLINRRVAEIQIFEKTYLIVIKDETGLKLKINGSPLFLIGSYV